MSLLNGCGGSVILVDTRAGSIDLIKPLRAAGLPIESTLLEAGDLCFIGRGVKDAPLFIGLEHKTVGDLINSLTSARLPGHQLPGMLLAYDLSWLVVEGDWQHDTDGAVTMFARKGGRRRVRGAPPAAELEKRLLTLEVKAGLHIRHCPTRRDTIRFISALYRWFTDKSLDQHQSHLALYGAPDMDARLAIPISDFRRIVAMIPGIGYRTSQAVEAAFAGSFRRMMLASEAQWAEIATTDDKGKTKRIGATKARQILEALR